MPPSLPCSAVAYLSLPSELVLLFLQMCKWFAPEAYECSPHRADALFICHQIDGEIGNNHSTETKEAVSSQLVFVANTSSSRVKSSARTQSCNCLTSLYV